MSLLDTKKRNELPCGCNSPTLLGYHLDSCFFFNVLVDTWLVLCISPVSIPSKKDGWDATTLLNACIFFSRKGKEVPPSFKQFFSSSLALIQINLSGTKLSPEPLK